MARKRKVHKGLRNAKMAALGAEKPSIRESSGAMTPTELEEMRRQAHLAAQRMPSRRTRQQRRAAKHRGREDYS